MEMPPAMLSMNKGSLKGYYKSFKGYYKGSFKGIYRGFIGFNCALQVL